MRFFSGGSTSLKHSVYIYIFISGGSTSLPAVAGWGVGVGGSFILAVTVQCACDAERVWG